MRHTVQSKLPLIAAALWFASALLAVLGCARPLVSSSPLADFETTRTIEEAAASDSIPSADEVGLTGGAASQAAGGEKPAPGASAEKDATAQKASGELDDPADGVADE